eukprot:gene23156-26218_t
MSLIVNGESSLIEKLSLLLTNYKALCVNESLDEEKNTRILNLVTKYYSAIVTLDLLAFDASDESVLDNAEGYILVPSEGDLSLPKYALSRAAVEVDTGLRILVALTEGSEVKHRPSYEAWALENSFEYVEINILDPVKDFQEREKSGLPRLIEALESNMWSTMQRAPKAPSASSSSSASNSASNTTSTSSCAVKSTTADSTTESYVAPTVPTAASSVENSDQNLPVPPAPANSATTATTTGASIPPVTSAANNTKSPADSSEALDPFDLELEDKEDNEIIDKYANFISEVKNFRTQATGGQLSDQARRDQAADMAMKLAMMMGMDDESDSGSD